MLGEAEIKARLEGGELTLGMLEERKQSLLEASEEVKAISTLKNRSEVNQPTPNNTKPLKNLNIPKLQELVVESSTPVNGLRECEQEYSSQGADHLPKTTISKEAKAGRLR